MQIPVYELKSNTSILKSVTASIEYTPVGVVSRPKSVRLTFMAGREYVDTIPVNYDRLTDDQKRGILYGPKNFDRGGFVSSKAYTLAGAL